MKLLLISALLMAHCLTTSYAVGDLQDIDANAEELKPVVQFSEQMMDKAINSLFVHKIGNVLKAQKQVVSGIKYYIEFEFRETTCLKNKPNDGVCDTTKTEICTAQVWSRAWLTTNKLQLVTFSCKAN